MSVTMAIVDVSNICHRALHVIRNFETFDDRLGQTITIVFQSLRKVYERFGAKHCVMCFDSSSWRKDVYPEYKANRNRQERTEEDQQQHEIVVRVLKDLHYFFTNFTNVTVLESRGIEADDFIARWTEVHDDPVFKHIIISADSDFKQLVRGNVELYNPISNTLYANGRILFQDGKRPKRDEPTQYAYGETWKIKTKQVKQKALDGQIDYVTEPELFDPDWALFLKVMRGDSSDNIKAAFPRVREERLRKAFANRGGEEWNNLINDSFTVGDDTRKVRPLYERNKSLIDLKAQPDEIKERIDQAMAEAMVKPKKMMVQVYFLKFCNGYRLPNLAKQADAITGILASPYDA